jgi:hypothetical protein
MLPAVEHPGERSLEEELDIQEQIRERVNEEELRNGKCESSLGEVRKKKDNKQTNSNNSLAYVHDWLWCKAADLGRRGGHNDRERVIDLLRAEALTCDVKGEFGRGQSMFPAGPTLAHTGEAPRGGKEAYIIICRAVEEAAIVFNHAEPVAGIRGAIRVQLGIRPCCKVLRSPAPDKSWPDSD